MRQQLATLKSARHALAGRIKRLFFGDISRTSPIVYPQQTHVIKTVTAGGVCTPLKGHEHGKQARFIRQYFNNFTNNIFANLYCESGRQPLGSSSHHSTSHSSEWVTYGNTSFETSAAYHAWKLCANEEMR